MQTEKATFAAGCFWGVEEKFRTLSGVISTRVGYIGGETENPSYEDVCSHSTGHAEAVEVTFDPEKISFQKLLDIFWSAHNPTQRGGQGFDIGNQYRSSVFYHSDEQKEQAEQAKEDLNTNKQFDQPIATEIVSATTFYEAEEYHQQYIAKQNGGNVCGV